MLPITLVTIPGIVDVLQLQLDCVVGNDVKPKVYRNAAAPLTIFIDS